MAMAMERERETLEKHWDIIGRLWVFPRYEEVTIEKLDHGSDMSASHHGNSLLNCLKQILSKLMGGHIAARGNFFFGPTWFLSMLLGASHWPFW
jgi:hypothetical protein